MWGRESIRWDKSVSSEVEECVANKVTFAKVCIVEDLDLPSSILTLIASGMKSVVGREKEEMQKRMIDLAEV